MNTIQMKSNGGKESPAAPNVDDGKYLVSQLPLQSVTTAVDSHSLGVLINRTTKLTEERNLILDC